MWPLGRGGEKAREIGRMVISNKGDSKTPKRGNYLCQIMRRRTLDKVQKEATCSSELKQAYEEVSSSVVLDYPRLSYEIWALVGRAIKEMKIRGQ